jgi:hypothetical protein
MPFLTAVKVRASRAPWRSFYAGGEGDLIQTRDPVPVRRADVTSSGPPRFAQSKLLRRGLITPITAPRASEISELSKPSRAQDGEDYAADFRL